MGMEILPDRFITWRNVPHADGSIGKKPLDKKGAVSSYDNPENWMKYSDAVATGRPIGFVFNGDGFVGIDPDSCYDLDKGWKPDAVTLFESVAGAAVEVSISGKGGHIVGRISNPAAYAISDEGKFTSSYGEIKRVDCFHSTGFLAFATPVWRGEPDHDVTALFAALYGNRPTPAPMEWATEPDERWTLGSLSVDELINKLLSPTVERDLDVIFGVKERQGPTVKQLWNAEAVALAKKFPHAYRPYDRSGAHQSLMNHLAFWCGKSPELMIDVFAKSPLSQDGKWRGDRNGSYMRHTVGKAIGSCTQVYSHVSAGVAKATLADLPGVTPPQDPNWRTRAVLSESGKEIPNVHNVLKTFRTNRVFHSLAYDEMRRTPVLTGPLPGDTENAEGTIIREIADHDITRFQEALQLSIFPKVGREMVQQAVLSFAREKSFHPLREYLERLQWDGTSRVETWLTRYLRAEDSPYVRGVGRMWIISAVARVFDPGCKADSLLILEGKQGLLKSTAAEKLAGPWFSDQLPKITHGDKDLSIHIRGKWIVEIAEMSAASKSDAEAIKSFISRRSEQFRPPFERGEVVEPRQCVFIGTTNQSQYLRDETGARRFWPVRVGGTDVAALERDRDQLFAEAVVLYRQGIQWWPDNALDRLIAEQGEERFESDPWEALIAEYVKDKVEVTVNSVLTGGLHIEGANQSTAAQRRVSNILMHRLKWRRGPRTSAARPFVPPAPFAIFDSI